MKLFGKVTRGELKELQDGLEAVEQSHTRTKASVKSQTARLAGIERRLRSIESFLNQVDFSGNEEDELGADEDETEEDRRERLLARMRRGDNG